MKCLNHHNSGYIIHIQLSHILTHIPKVYGFRITTCYERTIKFPQKLNQQLRSLQIKLAMSIWQSGCTQMRAAQDEEIQKI